MRHCQVVQPAGITLQTLSLNTPSTCDCVPKGLEHFNDTKLLSHFISALENIEGKGPQDFLNCQLCVGLTGSPPWRTLCLWCSYLAFLQALDW